jgi:ubiquinone/menaquinone biosynthesis C-methylase UbiE
VGVMAERFLSKAFGASNRLLGLFSPHRARRRSIVRVARQYDMAKEENEKFFLRLYLHHINERLERTFAERKVRILDAGCGQGRLAIPLAKQGHEVAGIDLSGPALNSARRYAAEEGVEVSFMAGSIEEVSARFRPESFDVVISTEVLYMVKDYERALEGLTRALKPGGLLILSLRPRMFYVLLFTLNNRMEEARRLALNDELYVNNGTLNCQSGAEMSALLERNGIRSIEKKGIGVLSGIPGDPQSCFVIPADLDRSDWDGLFQMEIKLGENLFENARYVLVSGIKGSNEDENEPRRS